MLLFALVFGLAGGSYYISKSFAASYPRSFAANTIQSAQKGHCHIEYTGGTYLGIAYAKFRLRSDIAGRRCFTYIEVTNNNNISRSTYYTLWSKTSWTSWQQATVDQISAFRRGMVQVTNQETLNTDTINFTVY